MPLVIEERDNLSCPIIRCDHCGDVIATAADGNYQWRTAPGPQPVVYTHKRCCWAFEHRTGVYDPGWSWSPLEMLPFCLAGNLKIDPQEAAATAALMASY